MKIRIPLYAQHLNQAEFVQLMSSTVDTLKQYRSSSNNPMVADLTQRLEDSLPLMKKSLKQKRGSDLTKELKQALKIRNIDFSAFVGGLKLFQNARTVEKLKAYRLLQELVELYKTAPTANMQESSALMDSLLARLAQPPYSEAVTMLMLEEAVANLRDSQEKSYSLYLQRCQDTSTRVKIDSAKIRKNMFKDYSLLYNHLVNKVSYDANASEKVILQILNDIRQDFSERNRQKNKVESNPSTNEIKTVLPQGKELETT
ncbi:hypothetical protein KQ224_01905 [Streptococcus parasuis]|jgi:hypothetical protein|uniref:DUF6261 family protein n=1 Tax=Streptococcus parasuis TaxID=1501662 RepID=UPI001C1FC345|nr:DUF6261 family protein [Streptococcus parasuis]QWV86909.1 hypothetical protein KQ224_01905 [Streptococcus parasuis]WDN59294.1 DUF6261 family protein [Streptococcus parasuis]WDN61127.1 DUF6261 family protein [Streptococcus parasuis]WFB92755.1 DUF6261 family protein [Streptococcus parasuis]